MLDALLNVLNGFTDIPFVELAWSHSPDDKYGVINLDNQLALDADADPVSEKMLTGFVDVFVKKPKDLSTVSDVESAMKRLGIYFALNSVQFEDDTGYVHYEWIWRDTTNILFARYRIIFHEYDGIVSNQVLPYMAMPYDPYKEVPDVTIIGLLLEFYSWDKSIERATQDASYAPVFRVSVLAENGGFVRTTSNEPFTEEQISYIVDDDKRVLVIEPDGTESYATYIGYREIEWDNGEKRARWEVVS